MALISGSTAQPAGTGTYWVKWIPAYGENPDDVQPGTGFTVGVAYRLGESAEEQDEVGGSSEMCAGGEQGWRPHRSLTRRREPGAAQVRACADNQATHHNRSSSPGRCRSRSVPTARTRFPRMCRRTRPTRPRATGSHPTGQRAQLSARVTASPLSRWGWASAPLWRLSPGCDHCLVG